MRQISNAELTLGDIPTKDATVKEILRFALTYLSWSGGMKAAETANPAAEKYRESGQCPESLHELRTCLFFEQRRAHWTDSLDEPYIRRLVEAIRFACTTIPEDTL